MLNRFVAAVRWLWQEFRSVVCRAFGWNQYWPDEVPPPRTRQRGALRAVLMLLAHGPLDVESLVSAVLEDGLVEPGNPVPYTRAQLLAALRYAHHEGYVVCPPARGEWKPAVWYITEAGLARLGRKAEAPVLTPKPGEWFPAKFGIPLGVPLAGQPIEPPEPPGGAA